MAKKRHYSSTRSEQYAGREESKMMKRRDSGLIEYDMSAPALLPMTVISKDFPSKPYAMKDSYMDDLFTGVQKQMAEDVMDARREFKPKKY